MMTKSSDMFPADAAVKEAVAFSVEARCSRLARGILRIGKKLRVMRADMASQTDALIAAIHAINDAGILMPDEVLDYASGVRAAQAQRIGEAEAERDKWQTAYNARDDRARDEADALKAKVEALENALRQALEWDGKDDEGVDAVWAQNAVDALRGAEAK